MLNNHEVNLTDEEAAVEVARVAKTYPVVRLLSADQIKSEPNCLLAGDRCPCLRQSSRNISVKGPVSNTGSFF